MKTIAMITMTTMTKMSMVTGRGAVYTMTVIDLSRKLFNMYPSHSITLPVIPNPGEYYYLGGVSTDNVTQRVYLTFYVSDIRHDFTPIYSHILKQMLECMSFYNEIFVRLCTCEAMECLWTKQLIDVRKHNFDDTLYFITE